MPAISWSATKVVVIALLAIDGDTTTAIEGLTTEGWYIYLYGFDFNGTYTVSTAPAAQYGSEAYQIQYVGGEQDFMQVQYKLDIDGSGGMNTAFDTPVVLSKYYEASAAVTSASATDLTAAAATSTTWFMSSYSTIWNSSAGTLPMAGFGRLMPEETDTTGLRVEVGTTATLWYDVSQAYEDSQAAADVSSSVFDAATGQSLTWAGASSLVATAATVMAAATLF